ILRLSQPFRFSSLYRAIIDRLIRFPWSTWLRWKRETPSARASATMPMHILRFLASLRSLSRVTGTRNKGAYVCAPGQLLFSKSCVYPYHLQVMPRRNPLVERETAISKRFQGFISGTGLSRAAFARKCGIDSAVLSRIAHVRSPLKYDVFLAAFRAFR